MISTYTSHLLDIRSFPRANSSQRQCQVGVLGGVEGAQRSNDTPASVQGKLSENRNLTWNKRAKALHDFHSMNTTNHIILSLSWYTAWQLVEVHILVLLVHSMAASRGSHSLSLGR